jgi:phage tail-like protein
VRAATEAENLLDYLPMTYGRNDAASNGFLFRWLQLLRGKFATIEEALNDMPRLLAPQLATPSTLTWLARCLGLELPVIASDDERRALIARAVALFARRGTRGNIAEFVELHTGIRPAITEAWTDRKIWILGESSHLDFDTRLPSLDPLGMVVPDDAAGKGCCVTSEDEPTSGCETCASDIKTTGTHNAIATPIGRAVVGESGPLASYQIGAPLFDETAYRFCVVVDRYRAAQPETLAEIARIVDREKPAHTDYRLELIDAQTQVGLQSCIGIDLIVGGDPPPLRLGTARLDLDTYTPPSDVARIGSAALDGMLALN